MMTHAVSLIQDLICFGEKHLLNDVVELLNILDTQVSQVSISLWGKPLFHKTCHHKSAQNQLKLRGKQSFVDDSYLMCLYLHLNFS